MTCVPMLGVSSLVALARVGGNPVADTADAEARGRAPSWSGDLSDEKIWTVPSCVQSHEVREEISP